jgi:hypothetical protein
MALSHAFTPASSSRPSLAALSTLCMTLALGACDSSKPATASPASKTATASTASSVACPSQELEAFVAAFAEDPALQRAFTADSVDTAFVDMNAQPEPVERVETLPRETLKFPVMPNRAQQQKDGLRYREVANDNGRAIVALEIPDTDAQLLYRFRLDTCWTLVKIVDPAYGKAFPGEAPPAANAYVDIVREVMRAEYGETYDKTRDCWATKIGKHDDERPYCMRAATPTAVETPTGTQLWFLASNIQDIDSSSSLYNYGHPDPGLAGMFAVALDNANRWTLIAASRAETLGSAGECGCADARPVRLGRDLHGWILASGGVWQGIVVSNYSIFAPSNGRIVAMGTFPDVEEDAQDIRHELKVDASAADAEHYPLDLVAVRGDREIGRERVSFDAKRMRYAAAKSR